MADGGESLPSVPAAGFQAESPAEDGHGDHQGHVGPAPLRRVVPVAGRDLDLRSPLSPMAPQPQVLKMRQQHSLRADDYFVGPRDTTKHSKWPLFMQMHGSILPRMIVPLLFLGGWSTCITCVSMFTSVNLGISSTLLTITGFVVGLGLSFRSSTAYERYAEGRRYWAQLMTAANSLGRAFWVHAKERGVAGAADGQRERDVLAKLTALRLVVAFAVALKHKLRFEPYADYDDLVGLVGHLDTCAGAASHDDPGRAAATKQHGIAKTAGEFLGFSFAASNPRKALKRARRPLGNLPLEILTYLARFTDELVENNQLPVPMTQTLACMSDSIVASAFPSSPFLYADLSDNNIAALNDVLTGTERVLTTPVPIAYAIAINQITWLYVFLLPFQLFSALGWITIPACVAAGYIILGLLFIGREIEDPFGHDVNDLPLDTYCAQVAAEMDLLASRPAGDGPGFCRASWIETPANQVLWPLSSAGFPAWLHRGEARLRDALQTKCDMAYAQHAGVSNKAASRKDNEQNSRERSASDSGSETVTENGGREPSMTRRKAMTAGADNV